MNTNTYKMTEAEVILLLDENTSVKTFKDLSSLASQRFNYIIQTMSNIVGRKVEWFDYDNEGGNEYSPGYFDTILYSSNISFVGEFKILKNPDFTKYDYSFPTSWLYQDFEQNLTDELNLFIDKKNLSLNIKKQKESQIKESIDQNKESVLSKLTEEEKMFIFFNSPEAIEENKKQNSSIKNLMEVKRASILSKLSDEEKNLISFQSFNQVSKILKKNEENLKIAQHNKNKIK